jgi:hypothetical protein
MFQKEGRLCVNWAPFLKNKKGIFHFFFSFLNKTKKARKVSETRRFGIPHIDSPDDVVVVFSSSLASKLNKLLNFSRRRRHTRVGRGGCHDRLPFAPPA